MLLLKLLQQLVNALNSEGTPGQVAAGIALGAALGLTPLMNLHNLVLFALALLFNVSLAGFMLGWAVFAPAGFLLDPLFDAIGLRLLLATPPLVPTWTELYNAPVAPYSSYNNTVVLGSLAAWLVASVPIFFLSRWAVTRYRATVYARLKQTRLFQAVAASKLYNFYRLFRPE